MRLWDINIKQTFPCTIAEVFPFFSDHERFGQMVGQPISCLKEGAGDSPYGVGSVRRIGLPLGLSFEETITAFEPNHLIEYRVTKGSPVKNHCGTMRFSEREHECHLDYHIQFAPRWPIPGLGALLCAQIRAPLASGIARLAGDMR